MNEERETRENGQAPNNPWANSPVIRSIASRGIGLLLILCGVKCLLLGNLAGHLYREHWRVDVPGPTLLEFASYYFFVALVPVTLVLIGRTVPSSNVGTIRGYNMGFILIGLTVVFLSLSRMKSNYLYPVMEGVLNLGDVWQYLKMDLFFEQPFLAVYLVGYAFLYYLLIRTRKEHYSFWILGGLGSLYLLLNLRALIVCRELLVINCLGLGGLVSCMASRRSLHWVWQAVPIGMTVATWYLFGLGNKAVLSLDPYLVLLLCLVMGSLVAANVLAGQTPPFRVLSHFLPFYFFAFFLLTNQHYPLARNLSHLVAYGLTTVHYFWQEAVAVGFLMLLALGLHRVAARGSLVFLDATALLLVLISLVDLKMTQNMGCRLDWQAVIASNSLVLLWRTIQPYAGSLALAVGVFFGAYFGFVFARSWWLGWHGKAGQRPAWTPAVFPVTCALLLTCSAPTLIKPDKAEGMGLTQVVATCPLVTDWKVEKMTASEFNRTAQTLGLAGLQKSPQPAGENAAPARDLNVFLIVMESSYNRYLSLFGAADETQPRLRKYRERMELFPNFYANFMNSLNARFAVVSGIYPCRPYVTFVNPRLAAPSLFEVLHDRGYVVSLFDSCYRDYQRWDDYLVHRKLDNFYDASTMPGGEKFQKVSWGIQEAGTTAAIRNQFARHAKSGEKFFLTYMPVAPHMPYDSPSKEFEKFDNGLGHLNNDYTGRYKNQLLYMDWVITGLLDELEALGLLEKTLVIITNDHGEMVGEDDGKLGHGWNLEPWLANVPLIIMDPLKKGCRVNPVLGSQVDILPTVLDVLNVPLPSGEIYQGVPLHRPGSNRDKVVYLNSHRPRAVIRGSRYILEDGSNGTSGQGGPVRVFQISQEGLKTHFGLLEERARITSVLDQFDRFQKSFILHYSYYRELARGAASASQAATR